LKPFDLAVRLFLSYTCTIQYRQQRCEEYLH